MFIRHVVSLSCRLLILGPCFRLRESLSGRQGDNLTLFFSKCLCAILLSSLAIAAKSECLPISNWSSQDAAALGGDPLGYMTVDNTPRLQYLNGTYTRVPVTWFGSPVLHPDSHWSIRVNIASYLSVANAAADFNDAKRFNSFVENTTSRFLLKEPDRWLFGLFRTSAQKELYNLRGFALYEGHIIEVNGSTAPGSETGKDVAIDHFLNLVTQAKTLINAKCGIAVKNNPPTMQLFSEKKPPFVADAVNSSDVTWGIVFEDLDGLSDIDFATLRIEKKIINQNYEDVSGVFMVKFLEFLNSGKVILEKTNTRLNVTFNTSFSQLRELIFEAYGPPYAYGYAYDMRFTVSDTKGSSGIATAPFWLGQSPNIWFRAGTGGGYYVLEISDYDKAADLRWDTFKITLDGIDFTGIFLDQFVKLMVAPLPLVGLIPTDLGLNAVFNFSSKATLCQFFFNASGQVGFHITDQHGYSTSEEYPLDCK